MTLLGYFMPGMEDRLQVERLINTCLVPFKLEPRDRMKKLLMLFGTIDENACKAFVEVHKNQLVVRKAVSEMVALHRAEKTDKRNKEIQYAIHTTSKHLQVRFKGFFQAQ